MKNYLLLIYAIVCYVTCIVAISCYAFFLADINLLPFTEKDMNFSMGFSMLINLSLIVLFALQHSLMARKSFKSQLKRMLPKGSSQSTYILFSAVFLVVLIAHWEPLTITLFDFRETFLGTIFKSLYFFTWLMLILASFQIDHFQLFGLKQAWLKFQNKTEGRAIFRVPLFYQLVRHPIYLCTIIIHWMTPVMTADRLILAVAVTIYVYIEIIFEEEELVDTFGRKYLDYSNDVPPLYPKQIKNVILPVAVLVLIFFITTSTRQ